MSHQQEKIKSIVKSTLSLQKLKRFIAACSYEHDERLRGLEEDPDELRKVWNLLVENDTLQFCQPQNLPGYVTREMRQYKIPENKIMFELNEESWGDAWPGSYDTTITTETTYAILSISKSHRLVEQMLKVEFEEDVWSFYNPHNHHCSEFETISEDSKSYLSLFEILSLHPKILDRLLALLGCSYNDILQMLN